jgi:hypothetical protein
MNFPLFLVLLANQGNIASLLRNQIRRILEIGVPEKITTMKMNEKKNIKDSNHESSHCVTLESVGISIITSFLLSDIKREERKETLSVKL